LIFTSEAGNIKGWFGRRMMEDVFLVVNIVFPDRPEESSDVTVSTGTVGVNIEGDDVEGSDVVRISQSSI
jgi:hypothetical protein